MSKVLTKLVKTVMTTKTYAREFIKFSVMKKPSSNWFLFELRGGILIQVFLTPAESFEKFLNSLKLLSKMRVNPLKCKRISFEILEINHLQIYENLL